MYQSVIRDPGGDGLIRIHPDAGGPYSAITNGTILIVPPGTTAFIAVNGILSLPYAPGRYTLFSGVDPLFVRLRHILTRGDPGTTVSVFFLSTERSRFFRLGTGEIPFQEHRFRLTMKALASCSLTLSIADPLKVLKKLVGSYNSAFSEEDLEPCVEQLVLTPVREAISRELAKLQVTDFNSRLSQIGCAAAPAIRAGLAQYGFALNEFSLLAIHIPDSEMGRLHTLEQDYAAGQVRTDLELDNLKRVWNGSLRNRMLSEMMTGLPSRGQAPGGEGPRAHGGEAGGMAGAMMQMMMLSQVLPMLREPLTDLTHHTDMFGGAPADTRGSTSSAEAPPPMPGRYRRCPGCNGDVPRGTASCPVCGYRFKERNGV